VFHSKQKLITVRQNPVKPSQRYTENKQYNESKHLAEKTARNFLNICGQRDVSQDKIDKDGDRQEITKGLLPIR
jgi:hypothetical protein